MFHIRECRRCLDLLSGPCSALLVWVPGPNSIPGKFMANELARAGTLLPEPS